MKHLLPYFKAFCEEHRLEIIDLLIEREHCICEIIEKLGLGQSTVSYHVEILRDTGLISCRYIGNSTFCSLRKSGFEQYASDLDNKLFKPVAEASPGTSPKASLKAVSKENGVF